MNCKLIRSDRKTLALEVDRSGQVIVRAPRTCPEAEIQKFLDSHALWLRKAQERQAARRQAHPEPTQEQQAALIARARELLPGRVAHWSGIMCLRPAGITITGARTRFGSCSAKNRLSFSWRLMQYPDAAIDYVVVHELAHIAEKNHSSRFYAVVAKFLPDWQEREKLLKG